MLTRSRMRPGDPLATTPYLTPAPGEPVRVALVASRELASLSLPAAATPEIEPLIVEPTPGAEHEMQATLREFRPHAVFCFDPDADSAARLDGVAAATVAFLCGSVPRQGNGAGYDALVAQIASGPGPGFDRVVSCDPTATEAGGRSRVWRSLPLPINDSLYSEVRRIVGRPRSMFVGRSTEHRERILTPAKHHNDLLHVVFGLEPNELAALLARYDVGVNVHARPGLGFSSRALMHLAAGQLLISEPLEPAHSLELNIDYLGLGTPGMLVETLRRIERFPDTYHAIRVRGRMKAEQFRASRVFARLTRDLFDDIAAFGTGRA